MDVCNNTDEIPENYAECEHKSPKSHSVSCYDIASLKWQNYGNKTSQRLTGFKEVVELREEVGKYEKAT